MKLTRLVHRSLVFHRRMHLAVALGVAAATAVLTGALLVGDSVRGSLRSLTLERLGRIDEVILQDRFFREQLVDELQSSAEFPARYAQAEPAILFPHATIERRTDGGTLRGSSVLVLGCSAGFWDLDESGVRPEPMPGENEVVLNATLAEELRARVGDTVTLRLPQSNEVPADSPLASKNDRVRGVPGLRVVAIVPASGLGQFSLQPSQRPPANAFVAIATLQAALDEEHGINAVFLSRREGHDAPADGLPDWLQPQLQDFGVAVTHVRRGPGPPTAPDPVSIDYYSVTTDRMVFSPATADVIAGVVRPWGGQPLLTYLANSIRAVGTSTPSTEASHGIPYSMVTAIDPGEQFPLVDPSGARIGPIADDEIVLNAWAAQDLGGQPGGTIAVDYFEPETAHGQAVERTAQLRWKAVAALTRPARPYRPRRPAEYDQPLTPANDPDLTPTVEGVTDQDTIADWDAPFPFDYDRVREADDEYWETYRTTPKAFVSYATGVRLWGSRFGQVTSFRVPAGGRSLEELESSLARELARHAAEVGFQWIPIRERQLAASAGTTPFDVLFLSLSFFVIAAALLMVSLLFRLGIDMRASEVGTLLALGLPRRQVRGLFLREGCVVAAGGAALGVLVGIGYARLMLAGLSHWWLGAITTPFLTFHASAFSLVLGYVLGGGMCVGTIAWCLRTTRHVTIRQLLHGQTQETVYRAARGWQTWLTPVCVAAALGLSLAALRLGGMAQGGAFVASGAALLAGLLLAIRARLHSPRTPHARQWSQRHVLWRMAIRNAARNPARSLITIALMATATFLIVAMSSFRLAPTEAGTGGFELIADSSEPIYVDLDLPERRQEFFGSRARQLDGTSILGLRVRAGDDASCNNLYQATQPRILGVTPQFVAHFDQPGAVSFPWADRAADIANPWRLLADAGGEADNPAPAPSMPRPSTPGPSAAGEPPPVPVVLDKNTALYSLHLYGGVGEEFSFRYDGRPVRFRVVGLLENSVLQGSLLIAEDEFRRLFPEVSGYRFFAIATPPSQESAVSDLLEDQLGDQGLDAVPAREVLEQLLAVQNTYLSTFQSLGALGLLLGTFGLATVQLRNVLERRGELALMRATGYRRRRLAELVVYENAALLAAGLATGAVAALLAVLPHKLFGEASVSWALLRDLALMLLAVLVTGLVSSLLCVRAVLRLPLLAGLRGE